MVKSTGGSYGPAETVIYLRTLGTNTTWSPTTCLPTYTSSFTGSKYLPLIFEFSKWVLQTAPTGTCIIIVIIIIMCVFMYAYVNIYVFAVDVALAIFTEERSQGDTLPPQQVCIIIILRYSIEIQKNILNTHNNIINI